MMDAAKSLDMIDDMLSLMTPTHEEIAYQTGRVVGFFPMSKTRRMVRLSLQLEKPSLPNAAEATI